MYMIYFISAFNCNAYEYECLAGKQCVPLSYRCDAHADCNDESDELGCRKYHNYISLLGTPLAITHANIVFGIEEQIKSFALDND